MRFGSDQKIDSEYTREGTCIIFVFTEPLGGIRHVSVREHWTATDWAEEIKYLSDVMYPDVEKIVLVMDNHITRPNTEAGLTWQRLNSML